jgi:hypothetical protein
MVTIMANQQNVSKENLDNYQVLERHRHNDSSSLVNLYIVLGFFCFFAICICLLQIFANWQTKRQLRSENEQLAMQVSIAKQDQTLQEERKRKYLCLLRPSYTMVVSASNFTTEEHGDSSLVKITGGTAGEASPATYYKENDEDSNLELGQLEAMKEERMSTSSFECHLVKCVVDICQEEDNDPPHQPTTAPPEEAWYHNMEDLPMPLKQDPVLFSAKECDETSTTSLSDGNEEYQHDLELGRDKELVTAHASRLLCLPVKDESGNPWKVHAECSICIMEYEVGDEVVWSTRRLCPHAFHSECILLWLSKGKKRCPICRQFFVPGQRVDDKEVIVQDEASDGTPHANYWLGGLHQEGLH